MYGLGPWTDLRASPRLIARLPNRLTCLAATFVDRLRFKTGHAGIVTASPFRDLSTSLKVPTGSGIASTTPPRSARPPPVHVHAPVHLPLDRDRARTHPRCDSVCGPFSDRDRDGTAPSGDSTGPDRSRPRPDGPPREADRTGPTAPPGPIAGPVPVRMEVPTECLRRHPRRTRRLPPGTGETGQRGRRRCGACPGGDGTRLR